MWPWRDLPPPLAWTLQSFSVGRGDQTDAQSSYRIRPTPLQRAASA